MSILFVKDQETESLVISKDETVPVGDNVVGVVVASGQVRAVDADGQECKIVDWSCALPTSLVGLEDDTNVLLLYGDPTKRPRIEASDSKKDTVEALDSNKDAPFVKTRDPALALMDRYGAQVIKTLDALKGVPIILSYNGKSIEGTVLSFKLDVFTMGRKENPRITVMISKENHVMSHVEFAHILHKRFPSVFKMKFWRFAWVEKNDDWVQLDKLLPGKVRSFHDEDMIKAFINQ